MILDILFLLGSNFPRVAKTPNSSETRLAAESMLRIACMTLEKLLLVQIEGVWCISVLERKPFWEDEKEEKNAGVCHINTGAFRQLPVSLISPAKASVESFRLSRLLP
jgi:hypothetical protein